MCNAADAGGCYDWTIQPIGADRAVGRLMKSSGKPNLPNTHIERFRIRVTRP